MRLRLLYLSMKRKKIPYLIPIFIIFVLVPFMIYSNVQVYGIETVEPQESIQMLIPIFSLWWIFLSFKEYIDGEGLEILYVYLPKRKSKLQDILLLFSWYALHVVLLHVALSLWFPFMLISCLQCLIQCCFFVMIYYALIFLLKTTTISYMILLVYYFMCMFFSSRTIFEIITVFSQGSIDMSVLINHYSIILFISLLFGLIGYLSNRKYYRLFGC